MDELPSDNKTGKMYYAAFKMNSNTSLSGSRSGVITGDGYEDGDEEEGGIYLNYPEDEVHHVIMLFDGNGKIIGITDEETEEVSYVIPLTLTPKVNPDDSEDSEDSDDSDDTNDPESQEPGDGDGEEETPKKDPEIESEYNYLFACTPKDAVDNLSGGVVLTVLNASEDLIERLKKGQTNNTAPYTTDYEKYSSFLLSQNDLNDYFVTDKNNKTYHTMSSSMVVSTNKTRIPAADGNLRFWTTPEDAAKDPYTLYVERLLAKYTVMFKDPETASYFYLVKDLPNPSQPEDEGNPDVQRSLQTLEDVNNTSIGYKDRFIIKPEQTQKFKYVTSYTRRQTIDEDKSLTIQQGEWKVNVVGWGINNFEQKQYLFKNFDPSIEKYYNSNNWYTTHRTFWAEDPHYRSKYEEYPEQYRHKSKFIEHAEVISADPNYEEMSKKNTNPLKCFSFNELSKKNLLSYTPENTFEVSTDVLGVFYESNQSHLRTGSHLIIGAQLLIDGFDNTTYNSEDINNDGLIIGSRQEVKTKLYMNDIYWTEEAYLEYVAEYLGYYMLEQDNKDLFSDNDGYIYINKEGGKATKNHFYLEPARIEGGDGWAYACPRGDFKFYIKNPNYVAPEAKPEEGDKGEQPENSGENDENSGKNEKKEEEYTEIGHEKLRELAYRHPELMAKCYTNGRMYYVSPTYHNPDPESFNYFTTGKFGTVRNHWYNFKVTAIKGLGTPVADPTQPIVPNNEPINNAIGITLQILGWHGQYEDVDIGSQKPGGNN